MPGTDAEPDAAPTEPCTPRAAGGGGLDVDRAQRGGIGWRDVLYREAVGGAGGESLVGVALWLVWWSGRRAAAGSDRAAGLRAGSGRVVGLGQVGFRG